MKIFPFTQTHTRSTVEHLPSFLVQRHECVGAVVPRVKKFSFNENQNCEKISNNEKTKVTVLGKFWEPHIKVILFRTLNRHTTHFRYTLMYKYFTFRWWKFVYSPTQTLNLDWYKSLHHHYYRKKYGAYERKQQQRRRSEEKTRITKFSCRRRRSVRAVVCSGNALALHEEKTRN